MCHYHSEFVVGENLCGPQQSLREQQKREAGVEITRREGEGARASTGSRGMLDNELAYNC